MGADTERERWLDQWRPGAALKDWGCVARDGAAGSGAGGEGNFECVVCGDWHATGNSLAHHYDTTHGVRDPEVATLTSQRCDRCMVYFPSRDQVRAHACAAKREAESGGVLARKDWGPVTAGPRLPPPPAGWWISTDGSGGSRAGGGRAGRGAVIFRWPVAGYDPEYVLHGPVVTEPWSELWVGAREHTNNTGELSAIAEAMLWLMEEAQDGGEVPVEIRYDSQYAANMARGFWTPKSNEELVAKTRALVQQVEGRRRTVWTHVYGHTGEHDNELADRAADRGARGEVAPDSLRWATPRAALQQRDPLPMYMCRMYGAMMPDRDIQGRVRGCRSELWVIPQGVDKCRRCGVLTPGGFRSQHEQVCL